MNNTIIVKSSKKMTKDTGLDSIKDIIQNGVARGFRGSSKIVQEFDHIIITDGEGESFIGEITNVTPVETFSKNGNKVSRVNVNFQNPQKFDSSKISDITWSSLNVRYTNIQK